MTLSSIILHQFEDTNVSLPGLLVQHLIQSQLNYRPLTIKVNIIYKYQILQGIHCSKKNISSNKKKWLQISIRISSSHLRAPKRRNTGNTPPPLPPTTYLQQSRPDPRHQGLVGTVQMMKPVVGSGSGCLKKTEGSSHWKKKHIWLFIFVPNVEEKTNQKQKNG